MSEFTGEQKLRIVLESLLRDVPKRISVKNMEFQKVNSMRGTINSLKTEEQSMKLVLRRAFHLLDPKEVDGQNQFLS